MVRSRLSLALKSECRTTELSDRILAHWKGKRPNSVFIDSSMFDNDGFVTTDEQLRVTGQHAIFAVGDIAATDPQHSSARNGGAQLVSHNIDCMLRAKTHRMKRYRWGSVIGVQSNGLTVNGQSGGQFRFPPWAVTRLVFPLIVRRGIYRGVRTYANTAK